MSVSTLVQKHDLHRIDLLKCDIEGSEIELFADCRDWIHRVKALLVETHAPYTVQQLYAALRANGWNFNVIHERPTEDFGLAYLTKIE